MNPLFQLARAVYRRFGGPGLGLQPLFQRFLQPESVALDGFHLHLDPADRMVSFRLAVDGEWAHMETEVFRRLVRPGAVVIDAGAHIGYFTLLASTLAGPSGRVYAFEPEPGNRALLEKNVSSNARSNVVVVPKGVCDDKGTRSLQLNARNTGAHSLFAAPGAGGASIEIETVALGPWMRENHVAPTFIKLDLEGGEWLALEGMSDFLAEKRPLAIVMEYIPAALRRSGREPRQWLDRLAALGFRFHRIDEIARVLTPMSADELAAAASESSCDLLCERD